MSGKKGQAHGGLIRRVALMKSKKPELTMEEIGKEVGRCRDTVGRILKTDEAQEIMAACHSKIIEKAPKAVDNILKAVDNFDAAYDGGDKVQASISWEATKLVTQIPGLTPSSQTSIVHQTFINKQLNMIDPTIAELIAKHLGAFKEAIDVPSDSVKIEEVK